MKKIILSISILLIIFSINISCLASTNSEITFPDNSGIELIINDPPLFIDAGPVQMICNGQSATLNAIATGGTPPYTYLWSDGSTNQIISASPSLPTTYTVTVTDSALDIASDQVFVIVNQSPQVYLGANQNACVGDQITLQETLFGTYQWSNGATTTSINVSTSGNYSLTVTDSNGCYGSDDVLLTFNALPNINLGPDVTIPYAGSIVLDAGFGYTSYQWSNGGFTQTINVAAPGTYSVTVNDPFGCSGSDAINITVASASFEVDAGVNQNMCEGDYATLSANPINGVPPYSYLWSSGETSQVIIVSPSSTTTYTVTATDSNSDNDFDNVTVYIDPSPTVNLGPNISSCEGQTVTINSNSIGTHSWSNASTQDHIEVTTTGIYSVTVTNANGCSTLDEITVTFNPLPYIDLGQDILMNPGDTAILDAGPGFSAYLWSTGFMTQSILATMSGAYAVSVTDVNGCGNSSTIQVNIINPNNPGWNYTTTSTNHSVLIPNFATININGAPIENGDYIGLFYDSAGTQACSGYIEWNGLMNGLAAWGGDSISPGFAIGEEFQWKIWKASTEIEYEAGATYMTGPTFPNAQYFTVNGTSAIESLTAPNTQGQSIELPFGWSIFSTYIIPAAPNIADVLSPIIQNVELVKNGDGQVYWPAYSVNLIGNTVIGDGYLIKVSAIQTLVIEGTVVIPENTPISVPAGWSLIGFLRTSSSPIAEIFLPLISDVELIKNGAGQVYWPAWGLNLIISMNPGEGYLVKLSNSHTLTYPPN